MDDLACYLCATLHTLGAGLTDRAHARLEGDRDRGSVTMEQVLWAVAVIAFVGIVVAAIRSFVTSRAAQIR